MNRLSYLASLLFLALPVLTARSDEQGAAVELRGLLAAGQLDAAVQHLDQSLQEYPESALLRVQHIQLASLLEQAKRPADAAKQIEALLGYNVRAASKNPDLRPLISQFLSQLQMLLQQAGQAGTLVGKIDALIQVAEEEPDRAVLQGILKAHKAMLLAQSGQKEEAIALVDGLVAEAQNDLEATPEDSAVLIRWINMQKTRIEVLAALDPDLAAQARTTLRNFLRENAPQHKQDADIVKAHIFETVTYAASLTREDPDQAESLMNSLQQFIDTLDQDQAKIKTSLARVERNIQGVRNAIETAHQQRALIGTAAQMPENVEVWVNGDPLEPGQLKGKVVVLDFWAIWSGPCVAGLPQLQKWQENYGDDGLVVIGATRYFFMDWNDQDHRIQQVPHLAPEKENDALERFAKYHKLSYRFAIFTDTSLMEHYVVKEIPQAVVIDRQGKIRLLRAGSGEQAAQEIEAAIKQCLAEPAPAE